MANEFIARNGLIAQNSSTVTGSLTVTNGITGSLFGTASWANNATSASYAVTASYVANASSFPYTGSAIISGSLSVIGPTTLTGSLAISSSATGSVFSVSASYIDFDFDSLLFSGSAVFNGTFSTVGASASLGYATATNALLTGSLFGTSSWSVSSSRATTSSFAITASFALNAGGGSGFPFTGSAIITGSLITIGRNTLSGSFTASNSESINFYDQRLVLAASTGSRVYQTSITPTFITTAPNQTSTALRVNPTFTGSLTGSSTQNIIVDFGAANVGSQFTVNDITSGSIYMVNDVSGLPIIEATSDWTVNMYDYPNTVFKKTGSLILISGSQTVSGSLSVTQGITGSLFGTSSWAENVTSASYALTASYALNGGGGSVDTGSLLTTASVSLNTITFIKGDGSTFPITVDTGSGAIVYGYNATASFTNQPIWAFTHSLGTKTVIIQALDSNFNQIIPSTITLNTDNTATLTFPVSQSGYAIASLGGNPISASYAVTASYALNGGGGGGSSPATNLFNYYNFI
jgi:hypothetical protein